MPTFVPRRLCIVLVPFLMTVAISLCYGLQYKLDRADSGPVLFYYLGFSALFAVLLAFITASPFSPEPGPSRLGKIDEWVGYGFMAASFTLTLFLNSKLLSPVPWHVAAAFAALLGAVLQAMGSSRASTAFFAIAALAFAGIVIARVEVWDKGDMLTSIAFAGREFLAGKQPYRPYPEIYMEMYEQWGGIPYDMQVFWTGQSQLSYRPFYYLPGVWLAYLPAVALGIDLRLLNLVFLAGLILVFERLLPIHGNRSAVLALTFYPLLLSPSFIAVVPAVHVIHYWLLLLVAVLCINRERYWLASAVVGIMLATRQPALFLVPPLIGWLATRLRWVDLVRYGTAAIGVYLAIMLPFAVWFGDIVAFWKHFYVDVASLGTNDVRRDIGFANLLDAAGISWSGPVIQLAIILIAAACVVVRPTLHFSGILLLLGVTYLWTIFFNTYSVRYVYYPGLLLVMAGAGIALGNGRGGNVEPAAGFRNGSG